jgi:hypothetical protein
VASLRKRNPTSVQLEVGGTLLVQEHEVADAFAKHFCSLYNTPFQGYSVPFTVL